MVCCVVEGNGDEPRKRVSSFSVANHLFGKGVLIRKNYPAAPFCDASLKRNSELNPRP